ncbi:MAG TPA: YceI family protein [Pyrinomonadaceae bacterium]|nr:YceI family protein [Pyrinomonadaceae bacterium]
MRFRVCVLPLLLSSLVALIASPNPTTSARASNAQPAGTTRYRLDPSQSKFVAHALPGGLLWFKGHDHLVAAREFSGEAELTTDTINPASLLLVVKSDSMGETNAVFTDQQKQIIDKELREIVLLPARYPDITFKSTEVKGKPGSNEYDLKIGGDLTLLGVTRHIEIPTHVTISGNDLRARGEFSIDRSDFKVKATSAFHGMIRVRNKIKFSFDIVGHQI